MRVRLGLSGLPIGDTLAQAAVSCFMDFGDATGVSFARPLDLNAYGNVELWLEGHSCVHREQYDHRELLAAKPKGRANRLRDLQRVKLDVADDAGMLPEALGVSLLRCGYTPAEVRGGAKGRKSEWQNLVSPAKRTKYGAALGAREPRTQLVEAWPTAGAITSGQSQSWAINSGSPLGVGAFVATGSGAVYCNGSLGFVNVARCTTPVSSADHWVTAAVTTANNYTAGVVARLNATNTYYCADCWHINARRLYKMVLGVDTQLSSEFYGGAFSNVTTTCRTSASTISAEFSGHATQTVTDPSIVGALLGGIAIVPPMGGSTSAIFLGSVTIDDGIVPAPVAAFSATPLSGSASLSVAFTDASTNSPTSWLWERSSDGGSNWSTFSTSQHPTASFAAGTWAIRLTASNAGGSDGETKLAYIVSQAPNRVAVVGQYGLGVRHGMGL